MPEAASEAAPQLLQLLLLRLRNLTRAAGRTGSAGGPWTPDWDDISQRKRDLPSCIEFVSHYRFVGNDGYLDVVLRIAGLLIRHKRLSRSLGLADQCRFSMQPQGFGATDITRLAVSEPEYLIRSDPLNDIAETFGCMLCMLCSVRRCEAG